MENTEGISHTGFHAGSFSVRDETRVAAQAARRRVRIMSATLHQPLPHHEPVAAPAARLGTGRWDLLVIPPETGAESAARLMAAASDYDGPPVTASALIAADETRRAVSAADRPLEPDKAGKYEGGGPSSAAVPAQTGRVSRLIIGM